MCGRYVIKDDDDIDEIEKILCVLSEKYSGTDVSVKTGEIFPTDNAPILSIQDGRPSLSLMKWGFPKWDGKGVVINAKSETATNKKMFAKPLAQRRCVIPSTGFYEWARLNGKTKSKYRFNCAGSQMLYMAGMYSEYSANAQDDPVIDRFVILTRAANDSVNDIHDRMPVILYKYELAKWLTDYDFALLAMQRDDTMLTREAVYPAQQLL